MAWRASTVFPELPDSLASHFAADGAPDRWTDKPRFFRLSGVLVAVVSLIALGLPQLCTRIPGSWFNLPNRSYWLAPERAEATRASVGNYLSWIGIASLVLCALVLEMVYEANLSDEVRLDGPMGWILGAYFGFWLAWIVLLLRRFRMPSSAEPDGARANRLRS